MCRLKCVCMSDMKPETWESTTDRRDTEVFLFQSENGEEPSIHLSSSTCMDLLEGEHMLSNIQKHQHLSVFYVHDK